MRDVIKMRASGIMPQQEDVLGLQGIPPDRKPPKNAVLLLQQASDIFGTCARPIGIVEDISKDEFAEVYKGQSLNAKETPVDEIFRKAEDLALFAITIGQIVHDKINELFEKKELALASMLDSVASAGAEKAADLVEDHFSCWLVNKVGSSSTRAAMRYSPGYCGWHVSGQKKLFEFLRPEEIGIKLRDSFLMEPLKSISGVLIAGKKEIHTIKDTYPFCAQCETHSCQERVRALMYDSGCSREENWSKR